MEEKIFEMLQEIQKEVKEFREEFKEHKGQTDEKFREVLNVVNDTKTELKKDIKELKDYMEGIAEVQGRHEAEIKFIKRQVVQTGAVKFQMSSQRGK